MNRNSIQTATFERSGFIQLLLKAGEPDATALAALFDILHEIKLKDLQYARIWLGDKKRIAKTLVDFNVSTSKLTYLTTSLARYLQDPIVVVLREKGAGLFFPDGTTGRLISKDLSLRHNDLIREKLVIELLSHRLEFDYAD